jgi:hypothetical protein
MEVKMKMFQFLVATILLIISAVVWADKPDPELPNPPIQVMENNVDADGNIAVHEQGIVAVELADELGKQRISWGCGEPFPVPSSMASCLDGGEVWTVPEGKVLVIETISLRLTITPGELATVHITTQLDGEETITFIPMHYIGQSVAGPWDKYTALYDVKLYSDYDNDGNPVDTPLFIVEKANSTGGYIQGSISGYLIDSD